MPELAESSLVPNQKELKISRKQAIKLNLKRYHGAPCKNCKETLKYTANHSCVKCAHGRRHNENGRKLYQEWKKTPKGKHSNRKDKLKARFNLTIEEYENLVEQQEHKCSICGIHKDELSYRLCMDHNHDTGQNRGLLCKNCNLVLGNSKEDIVILQQCIEYLKSWSLKECLKLN